MVVQEPSSMQDSGTPDVSLRYRHLTLALTCLWKPQRGTSAGWSRSGTVLCSARSLGGVPPKEFPPPPHCHSRSLHRRWTLGRIGTRFLHVKEPPVRLLAEEQF